MEVLCRPCPLFVPLVENGRFRKGDVVIETVAREYLTPLLEWGADTLILGCTHYPLLEEIIADVCGPGVTLVSAGETEFYVSDRAEDFEQIASVFLQENLRHTARRVDIEGY